MNVNCLSGRLTRDPELTTVTSDGQPIEKCTMSLAVDGRRRGQDTSFIPLVAWRGTAVHCANHLMKGSMIEVTGSIRTYTYKDREGKNRSGFEVVCDDVRFIDKWNKSGIGGDAVASEDTPLGGEVAEAPEETDDLFAIG